MGAEAELESNLDSSEVPNGKDVMEAKVTMGSFIIDSLWLKYEMIWVTASWSSST